MTDKDIKKNLAVQIDSNVPSTIKLIKESGNNFFHDLIERFIFFRWQCFKPSFRT